MPAPRLLALDLDGTLLDPGGDGRPSHLPDEHAAAVAELRRREILIALVTGRPLLTTRDHWRRLDLDTPLSCFNGVWTGWPDRGPFDAHPLTEVEVRAVIEALEPFEGSICAYPGDDRWVMHRFTDRTRDWDRVYGVAIEEDPVLIAAWRGPSNKVMFVCEPDDVAAVAAALRSRLGDAFHVVVSQEDRLEVHRRGVTKAWGLERIAERLRVPREEVWAVGDAANDAEMLRWAGRGFAMGHAPDELLEIADAILPGIAERGLAALGDHL